MRSQLDHSLFSTVFKYTLTVHFRAVHGILSFPPVFWHHPSSARTNKGFGSGLSPLFEPSIILSLSSSAIFLLFPFLSRFSNPLILSFLLHTLALFIIYSHSPTHSHLSFHPHSKWRRGPTIPLRRPCVPASSPLEDRCNRFHLLELLIGWPIVQLKLLSQYTVRLFAASDVCINDSSNPFRPRHRHPLPASVNNNTILTLIFVTI